MFAFGLSPSGSFARPSFIVVLMASHGAVPPTAPPEAAFEAGIASDVMAPEGTLKTVSEETAVVAFARHHSPGRMAACDGDSCERYCRPDRLRGRSPDDMCGARCPKRRTRRDGDDGTGCAVGEVERDACRVGGLCHPVLV